MNVQLNSPCRSVQRVLSNFLEFGFRITKKQYFDPILGVSIKMYLLPGFICNTFETYMNVQLRSPCRSVQRVLSKFLSQFFINRFFISQKLINFNLFHTVVNYILINCIITKVIYILLFTYCLSTITLVSSGIIQVRLSALFISAFFCSASNVESGQKGNTGSFPQFHLD